MNQRDQSYLHFLLTLKTEEDWQKFLKSPENDAGDFAYAFALIQKHLSKLTNKYLGVMDRLQTKFDLDCSESKDILQKICRSSNKKKADFSSVSAMTIPRVNYLSPNCWAISKSIGRNESCTCGSGFKFKFCHGKL
jgi:SEC-C motif